MILKVEVAPLERDCFAGPQSRTGERQKEHIVWKHLRRLQDGRLQLRAVTVILLGGRMFSMDIVMPLQHYLRIVRHSGKRTAPSLYCITWRQRLSARRSFH